MTKKSKTTRYNITVNRQCTRCPRVESTEVSAEEVAQLAKGEIKESTALTVWVKDEEVGSFEYLCTTCTTIVSRYLEHVLRHPKHQSALREKGSVAVEVDGDAEEVSA